MRSSDRDQRIVIERATATTGGQGDEVSTWAEWTKAFAQVRWGSGNERLIAAQTSGTQGATFTVQSFTKTRAVTIGDRLIHAGSVWNIVAIAPIGRDDIAFTCTREVK